MNKYLVAFQFIVILSSGCKVLHEKEVPAAKPAVKKVAKPSLIETPTLYAKSYKFKTGQSYLRSVERSFYGKQIDMQSELSKYDIKKGFNIEQYNKYSKASFFQTDEYKIPDDFKFEAIELFAPLFDTLFQELESQNATHAEILVLGYTDETPIPYESSTYSQLLSLTKQKEFINNEYYNVLSYYRALEAGDLLFSLLSIKKESFSRFQKASIDIIIEGRGIEYPDASRSYELEDDKRKIAKVYWKIYK